MNKNLVKNKYYNVVGAGTCMIGITYGLARYSYGLFMPYIQTSYHVDLFFLGIIGSLSYVGYLVATLMGSIISGKSGPKIPLVMGGLCAIIGMLLVSFSTNIWLLSIGIIIAGMSPGLAYPPLSDIVVKEIKQNQRDSAFAIINAGTSLGVVISAPLALLCGTQWRIAWFIFAIISIFVTVWNYKMCPKGNILQSNDASFKVQKLSFQWLFNKKSYRVFLWALLLGIVSSAIWTYSVEYIQMLKEPIVLFGTHYGTGAFSNVYWIIIGISGILGVFGGHFVNKFGIKNVTRATMLKIAIAAIILILFPTSGIALIISSLLFGVAFMLGTAYLGIWSINIFYERPSAGMGIAFMILSIGQLIGPVFFGYIGSVISIHSIFITAFVLGIATMFIKPKIDIFNMTPTEN